MPCATNARHLINFSMQKILSNKVAKKVATDSVKRSGYLRNTNFIIGAPESGGNSSLKLAIYYDNGEKPLIFYSKDCSNLMKKEAVWSKERGLEYLIKIWNDCGTDSVKFSKNGVRFAAVYPAAFGMNQTVVKEIFKKMTPSVTERQNQAKNSIFQLLVPKRLDLRIRQIDVYKYFQSKDVYFVNDTLNVQGSMESLFDQFKKWEDYKNSKTSGKILVQEKSTKKFIAEMDRSGVFFRCNTTIALFYH